MAVAFKHSKPLDRKKLLEDCDEEVSFVNRCLQIFVRDTEIDMDGISAALEKHDFRRAAGLAHRIKGASATIRARFLQEEAARLQAMSTEEHGEEAAQCFSRLKSEFDNFKRFIAALPPLSD
jgi:HPt (histidine-containing phosphotransfer) domain-containing protein